MIRATPCSSSGESIVSKQHLVYVTLCRWPSSMQAWMELQSDIYQMSYWYNWFSWWWARVCSKRVENWNKRIEKRIVRQVGYLQELYRDTCSAERKILEMVTSLHPSPKYFSQHVVVEPPRSILCLHRDWPRRNAFRHTRSVRLPRFLPVLLTSWLLSAADRF